MLEFFKTAFSALPAAASSPLAFVAYLALVVGWVIISLRVKRNKQLLGSLEKLPEIDRLKALQMEMGTIEVAAGLTPEQWLRSRIHSYYFWGFAILCLVVVIIFTVAATTEKVESGTANVDVTLFEEQVLQPASDSIDQTLNVKETKSKTTSDTSRIAIEPKEIRKTSPLLAIKREAINDSTKTPFEPDDEREVIVLNEYDRSGGNTTYASGELSLTYSYDRVDKKILIQPEMPYLSLLARGGPIKGLRYWWSPFQWQFPKLSVKIVNNTTHTLLLTEAIVKVDLSRT